MCIEMKAVAGTKYLYHRRSGYYFRMRVPKRLGIREFRSSLRTKELHLALKQLSKLKPAIQMIKQLVVESVSLDTEAIKYKLAYIKEDMKKSCPWRT